MTFYKKPQPKRRTKKDNQLFHSVRRARERHGVELGEGAIKDIVRMIQTGRSRALRVQSNRVTIHRVVFENVQMDVAYDKRTKCLATVLPGRNEFS